MSNQRPPGGLDDPTHDPERERPGASPQPWVDPNRTQRYSGRRSIVDRLKEQSREPERLKTEETVPPPAKPGQARPQVASSAQMRAMGVRPRRSLRLGVILIGVIVLGLAGGAAAAWFSGWRPSFLGGTPSETVKGPDKPGETKPETKPGEPATPGTPTSPPTAEIPRSCYTGISEVKPGAATCGFALDAAGALSFQGAKIADRLTVGSGPAARLTLYPFSSSGRFVVLRACDGGSRCDAQRLVDTKEKKIFEVNGAEGFAWVIWSPKETMGLLGWRENLSDTIAVVTTADGKVIRPSTIRTAKNRYALVRFASVRWVNEESFSAEVKLCPPGKNRARNADCEKDDEVRYRRRTVKIER